jgi:hypothetical protein
MRSSELNRFLAELTSFGREARPSPPVGLDWEELAGVAERQGLAAIISYQLDYRFLAYVRPPQWARERLLMSFNGWVSDNLLKIQHLRRQLSEAGIPPLVLLGSIAVAETFYPHIAFRPLEEIDLWVLPAQLGELTAAMNDAGLAAGGPGLETRQRSIAARFANPDLDLRVWTQPAGLTLPEPAGRAMWDRKLSAPVFGPAAFRLDPADAVCAHVGALALAGFAVQRIQLVDLREMLLRADVDEGFYTPKGKGLRWSEVRERSRGMGLDRSLWTALRLVAELFPEVAAKADARRPGLPARVRAMLEELVVRPALDPNRTTVMRAVNAIRRRLLR